jgi:hypothetical protein
VLPAAVQGEQAAAQICAAAGACQPPGERLRLRVLLTRGGGSLEDLWAFNDEALARAIAASGLPVVSAVGHEVDVTIADFAADVRAPTPSAAAELLSGDQQELLARLAGHAQRLHSLMRWRLAQSARDLEQRRQRLRHPGALLREQAQRLDDMELRMGSAIRARLARREHALQIAALRLAALSPARRINAARGELAARRTALEQRAGQQLDRRRQRLRHYQSTLQALDPLSVLGRGFARGSVLGGQARIDDDVTAFEADVLADGQVLENPRHHLPRGTDAIGDILLRELLADVQRAVTALLGQIHEHVGHAPVDVLQRQALDVRRELAHPRREVGDQLARDTRVRLEDPVEVVLVDNAEHCTSRPCARKRSGWSHRAAPVRRSNRRRPGCS